MDKYVYYTITPREQMFKQLSGFIYFLNYSNINNKILVLPSFEIKGKKYNFSQFFNAQKIKEKFKVIDFDDYVKLSSSNMNIGKNTESFIDGSGNFQLIKPTICNIENILNTRKNITI